MEKHWFRAKVTNFSWILQYWQVLEQIFKIKGSVEPIKPLPRRPWKNRVVWIRVNWNRVKRGSPVVHLPMKFAKCQICFSISYTKYEIFIPFSQPWSQLQSKRHLEVKIKIYTASCFAVTQTTFSTPFLHHRILYSSIFWNFGKLQVSN